MPLFGEPHEYLTTIFGVSLALDKAVIDHVVEQCDGRRLGDICDVTRMFLTNLFLNSERSQVVPEAGFYAVLLKPHGQEPPKCQVRSPYLNREALLRRKVHATWHAEIPYCEIRVVR